MTTQSRPAAAKPEAKTTVTCRVLKPGEGRISTGEHVPGVGDTTFARGDSFEATPATGAALEARGLVEVQ